MNWFVFCFLKEKKKKKKKTYQTYINNQDQEGFIVLINYKLRVFLLCLLWKIFFKKCVSKNQIILFSFCWPTNPIFFAVLSVDQKINLVSPKTRHIIIGIISIHNDVFVAIITIKMCVVIVSFNIDMIKWLTFLYYHYHWYNCRHNYYATETVLATVTIAQVNIVITAIIVIISLFQLLLYSLYLFLSVGMFWLCLSSLPYHTNRN